MRMYMSMGRVTLQGIRFYHLLPFHHAHSIWYRPYQCACEANSFYSLP